MITNVEILKQIEEQFNNWTPHAFEFSRFGCTSYIFTLVFKIADKFYMTECDSDLEQCVNDFNDLDWDECQPIQKTIIEWKVKL